MGFVTQVTGSSGPHLDWLALDLVTLDVSLLFSKPLSCIAAPAAAAATGLPRAPFMPPRPLVARRGQPTRATLSEAGGEDPFRPPLLPSLPCPVPSLPAPAPATPPPSRRPTANQNMLTRPFS